MNGTQDKTTGVLAIWHDIEADAGMQRELFEWYNREHHVERFEVPGFVRARRYAALEGSPSIFSRYDTTDPAVLASDAYLERVNNPSPWTSRCMPHYRNMSRTVCRVVQRFGRGEGGKLATIRFDAAPGAEADLTAWLCDEALPVLVEAPGVVGGQLITADESASGIASEEKKMRGGADEQCGLALLVTGNTAPAVKAACGSLLVAETLVSHGAAGPCPLGIYELVFDLSALD